MRHFIRAAGGAVLGLVALACGDGGFTPDPGVRTEDAEAVDLENLRILVSGQAAVFPEAVGRGAQTPSLSGMTLSVEEPLRVAVSDASATFATGTVAEDGTFRVTDVPVRDIHQGLGVGLAQDGFVRSTTLVYDTAFTGTRPRTDIVAARAWALPAAFVDQLGAAVGVPRLMGHTGTPTATLATAGFVLGRVVDLGGQPVSGARVALDRADLADRLYYPSEDLTSVSQTGTASHGLFLYVHSASGVESFKVSVEGQDAYVPRNVDTGPGLGVVLTVYPGRYAP
ncbi:carboxypeptidase regulatory-like domain-containing protein [Corallococcus sp. ZKHCc1 1396]|uniref:Carboxypeptidase regulatory-like domain-containing protein n=1 Tax=Corallococcus soli TaxID=2710757 RepID=A0ABR9PQW3_9BACT|nr:MULTISPECIES: carboxypeptidase regulatory-like domain-containing protein [Corallococcus]MBE4750311.1 carboxypeptidase regulatory-like domain-containing protein [Corallococcus soli]MCY1032879.1 carboxypeptidase regulatory-like domain-containing protein [Corallococcus sp. BB11-1]